MDPSTIPKMQSPETSREQHLPGVYEHKDTDAVFITSEGDDGVLQADALMSPAWKGAWERVGDVPSRVEILAMRKKQQIEDAANEKLAKDTEKAELEAEVEKVVKKKKGKVNG